MVSPENDPIGDSLEAFRRSIYTNTNTAFCEASLREALPFTFRNQSEGIMILMGAALVCSQLDSIVSSAALVRFSQEDQKHTEELRRLLNAGQPNQAVELVRSRYRGIEKDLEVRNPSLHEARRDAIEILSGAVNGDKVLIEAFAASSLRAYRRFQLQEESGIADAQVEESIDRSRVIPFVRKTTTLGAYFRIAFDRDRFVDETFDALVTDNLKWMTRLKVPMINEEEGYENYSLYAALVCHCFLEEFGAMGKPFPGIDTEIDAASEAEYLQLLEVDPEAADVFQRNKRLRVIEEMGSPDQNPNLFSAITYLYTAQGLDTGSRSAVAASLGAYHAYNSIKNQLEADYWKGKI